MSHWDADIAEAYAAKYGEYATNRLGVERVEWSPTDTVLDVGCGTGAALRHVARWVTEGVLIGVDAIPRMVEIARDACDGTSIEVREGVASALPVSDSVCDVVLAFDSLDHWADPAAGFAEVRRVLREVGRLVVVKDLDSPMSVPMPEALEHAGFTVVRDEVVEQEGVRFRMWTSTPS